MTDEEQVALASLVPESEAGDHRALEHPGDVVKDSRATSYDSLSGYALFLDKLKDPSAGMLVARVKLFVSKLPLSFKRELAAEKLHSFVSRLEEELPKIEVFNEDVEDGYLNAKEGLEKLILKPLSQHFFEIDPLDKAVDAQLSAKILRIAPILRLHEHLHGPVEFQDESVLELGVLEFQKIDSYRAPRDKLQCILNGFRVIRHALDSSIGASRWGADQLLPLCIFCIVKANPKNLNSNVQFISHFRHPSRLRGEDEYLLMQVSVAIRDILDIDEVLLKPESQLTVEDVVRMRKRIKKQLLKLPDGADKDALLAQASEAYEIKISDISKFVAAYSQILDTAKRTSNQFSS